MTPDPSRPGGTSPGPGHPQDRPSLRLRLAAALLRSGEPPEQVARRTRVPLALINLLADEITATAAGGPTQVEAVREAMVAATEAAADRDEARAVVRRGRRTVVLFRIGLVAIAVNLAASITADLGHHYALGVVSVVLAPTLVLGLIWSITRPPRRRPHRHRP